MPIAAAAAFGAGFAGTWLYLQFGVTIRLAGEPSHRLGDLDGVAQYDLWAALFAGLIGFASLCVLLTCWTIDLNDLTVVTTRTTVSEAERRLAFPLVVGSGVLLTVGGALVLIRQSSHAILLDPALAEATWALPLITILLLSPGVVGILKLQSLTTEACRWPAPA